MFYIDQKLTIYSGDDLVGYLLPSDGLKEAKVDSNLNSISELVFTLPFDSPKWSLLEDPDLRIQVDGREFRPLNPIEQETTGSLIGKVTLSESQCMLGRRFPTVGSVPYEVTILASDSGEGGFEAGSAGSAIHRILTAGGTTPDSPSFTRASTAYNPETGAEVAVNEPRYVAGPFPGKKAWFGEEGTENLLTENQSSVETDTSGFSAHGSNSTIARVTNEAWVGSASLRVTVSDTTDWRGVRTTTFSLIGGTTYTLSFHVKGQGAIRYAITKDGTWTHYVTTSVTVTSDWQRIILTFTPPTTASDYGVAIEQRSSPVPSDFYIDGLQLEAKSYPTSWHLGGATRSPELPTIPIAGVVSPSEGTWEQRVYVTDVAKRQITGQYPNVFYIRRADGGAGIILYHSPNAASWTLEIRDDSNQSLGVSVSDSYTQNGWHLFRVTWKQGDMAVLRIDGVDRGSISNPNLPSGFYPEAYVGNQAAANYLNTAHDDLRLSSISRTDDQDLTAYQSGKPLPVDEHTTYKLNFDGSLTPEKIGLFGWSVGIVDVSGSHDLETEKKSVLENLHEVQKIWGGWLVFDSVMKTVSLRDDVLWINDTGYEIRYKKNEKSLKKIKDWNGVVTRLIPLGEKDLSISSVNGGSPYIENFSFTTEIRESFWRREDIYNPTTLKTEATAYLAKVCKPKVQYKSEILDLRTLPAYSHESLSLGDIVTIQDEDLAIDETVRVIGLSYDVIQPWKCSLVLGDPLPSPYDPIGVVDLKKEFNGRSVGGLPLRTVSRTPATIIVADRSTSRDFRRADYVVPLGATDAQVTIQEAIDDLPATGGKVVLLDGTYKIDDAIYMPSRCALEGQGSSTVIDAQQTASISIKNKLADDTDISVRNMRITRSVSNAFQLMGVRDSIVEGVWMEDSYIGISLHDCSGVAIKNNVVRNMSYWGISVVGITEKIQVTGNLIYNCSEGINAFSSEASAHWHQFSGNTIRESKYYGIELFNSSRNTVSDNVISRSGSAGIYVNQSSHNRITGNLVEDSGLSSDLIHPGIRLEFTADYNSIEENVIRIVDSVSHEGTAVSGTSNTIKLSAEASTTNDDYNNRRISITSGTGSGQDKKITDYIGSTQTATVDTNWATVPDATSVYKIYARPSYGIGIGMLLTTPTGNLITNNDLYNSGITGSLYDHGTGTITAAGNRL